MHPYLRFKEELSEELKAVNRSTDDVRLIVVSKQQSLESIQEVYDLGVRDFAENRVQELIEKAKYLPNDIHWHYLGELQKNKVNKLLKIDPLIHSIDSVERALYIDSKAVNPLKGFLQINVTKECSKNGVFLEDLEDALLKLRELQYLNLLGFMTMTPLGISSKEAADIFKTLQSQSALFCKVLNKKICYLSMGMSQDYKEALACGASYIRIGRAIFES